MLKPWCTSMERATTSWRWFLGFTIVLTLKLWAGGGSTSTKEQQQQHRQDECSIMHMFFLDVPYLMTFSEGVGSVGAS